MKVKYVKDGVEEVIDIDEIKNKEGVSFMDDIDNKIMERKKKNRIKGKICAITPFICVIAYVLMGTLANLWHPGWIVFFLIPAVPTILYSHKNNVQSYIVDVICMLIFIGYFVVGFVFKIWHPTWVAFLLIPVLHILFDKDK